MLINLTFHLLSNSWPPFPLLPLQILHTLSSPHTPSNTCENKIGGPLWKCADLSNKNMASMYETRFWSGRSLTPLYDENPLKRKLHTVLVEDVSILRRKERERGVVTKKMRQTSHSWLWDTIISQHYTFLLDLCVCCWELQTCSWTIKTEDDPFI